MKRLFFCLLALLIMSRAHAELVIEITAGRDNPTSIAVVPFAWSGWGGAPEDVAAVMAADLLRSGQFAPVERRDMLSLPTQESLVFYNDWRATNVEYLLIGRVQGGSSVTVEYELFDVYKQERIIQGRETGPAEDLRMLAHRASDRVYEQLTGVRGAFATKILYVAVTVRVNAKSAVPRAVRAQAPPRLRPVADRKCLETQGKAPTGGEGRGAGHPPWRRTRAVGSLTLCCWAALGFRHPETAAADMELQ